MKVFVAKFLEWGRPAAIILAFLLAETFGSDAVSTFHILGPLVVIIMSGSVAMESLFLGETASAKIGYKPDREYQVQSGLNNLAIALTAFLVFVFSWGLYAEVTVVTAMLLFFALSSGNHLSTALRKRNLSRVNMMRPVMTILLVAFMLPYLIAALRQ